VNISGDLYPPVLWREWLVIIFLLFDRSCQTPLIGCENKGGEIKMKTSILKTAGRMTTRALKALFFTGSFFIFIWIAYSLSLIAVDWLEWSAENKYTDETVVLLKG
jgi:hypothetical protein